MRTTCHVHVHTTDANTFPCSRVNPPAHIRCESAWPLPPRSAQLSSRGRSADYGRRIEERRIARGVSSSSRAFERSSDGIGIRACFPSAANNCRDEMACSGSLLPGWRGRRSACCEHRTSPAREIMTKPRSALQRSPIAPARNFVTFSCVCVRMIVWYRDVLRWFLHIIHWSKYVITRTVRIHILQNDNRAD